MSTADFVSSMAVMYLIHKFGPYRQYLRNADYMSRSSFHTTASRLSTKSGMLLNPESMSEEERQAALT